MPFEPTTPETKKVKSVEDRDITTLHITSLHILLDPNDATATAVEVTWAEGDMSEGVFRKAFIKNASLSGADVLTKINEVTDGVSTVYQEVKKRVWDMLEDRDLINEGTMT